MAIRYLSTTENLQKQPIIDPRDSPPNRSREGQLYYNTNSKGLQLYDGTSWSSVGSPGTVTSVGLSMPTAFSVANSPITGSGTLSVTGAGTSSQVVLGDGTLGPLPTGDVTGTGTTNYLSKFTGSSAIGDSIVFDNGTNVGIGTTSPSEKLEVVGNVKINRADNTSSKLTIGTNRSFGRDFYLENNGQRPTINAQDILDLTADGGDVEISLNASGLDYISFATEASERMRINNNGNVGIGTTSPAARLNVKGSGTTSSTTSLLIQNSATTERLKLTDNGVLTLAGLYKMDASTGGAGDLRFYYGSGGGWSFNWYTNNQHRVRINDTGLGINTTAPTQKLHVDGNARITGAIYDSNNTPGTSGQVLSSTATGTDWVSLSEIQGVDGTGTANYVTKWSDSDTVTDSIIFDNGTNVGIGTTSPARKFHLQGGVARFHNAVSNYLEIDGSNSGSNNAVISNRFNQLQLTTNAGAGAPHIALLPGTGGNVGIGTTSPGQKLEVSDNIKAQGHLLAQSYRLNDYSTYNILSNLGTTVKLEAPTSNGSISIEPGASGITSITYGNSAINSAKNILNLSRTYNSSNGNGTAYGVNLDVIFNETGGNKSYVGYFANYTETAFLGSTGNLIQLQRDSVDRFLVDRNGNGYFSGNVGIGTASPASLLEISQQLSAASTIDYPYTISSRDDGNSIDQQGGEGVGIKFRIAGNDAATPGNSVTGASIAAIREFSSDTNSSTSLGLFVTQNDETLDEAVRITSAGKVGIGTTSPSQKLDVIGNAIIAGSTPSSPVGTSATLEVYENGANSTLVIHQDDASATTKFAQIRLRNGGNDTYIKTPNSTHGLIIDTENDANALTISNNGGNVGISTASAAARLHVKGAGTTNSTSSLLVQNSATTELFRVRDDGNVYAHGSGTISSNAAFGKDALIDNTTGSRNTAFGSNALQNNVEGSYNTAIGALALQNQTASGNTYAVAVGAMALLNYDSGGYGTIAIGANAGRYAVGGGNYTGGTSSIFIGYHAKAGGSSTTNEIVIGQNAEGAGHNTITLGNSNITNIYTSGNITLNGDAKHIYFGGSNTFIGERSNSNNLQLRGGGSYTIHTVFIDNTGQLGLGTSAPIAKLHAKGLGTTSSTTSLLVENSSGTDLFTVRDDGSVYGVGAGGVDSNAAYGKDALINNTTGSNNVAIGHFALYQNTTGNENVGVGCQALNNTTASKSVAVGYRALFSNTTGGNNTASGYKALNSNTTGGQNTASGYAALILNATGSENTANGGYALYANTTGSKNVAFGYRALYSNTTTSSNTALGYQSLYNNTASNNTASGYRALYSNTTGTNNTASGYSSLYANTTGSHNAAFGLDALKNNTTGSSNVAFGREASFNNTTANNNTALGRQSLYSNTTASDNTAIGYETLKNNTTGSRNVAVGKSALNQNISTSYNTAVGMSALSNNIQSNITAVGYEALLSNTTGSRNTAVGYRSLKSSTTTSDNTSLGYLALQNSTGSKNTAVGASSLAASTTGSTNTALGHRSLLSNTTGGSNTAVGDNTLKSSTTASDNTAIGASAMFKNTTGQYNTVIGKSAMYDNVSGNNNVAVGREALQKNTASNNTAVGFKALKFNTSGTANVASGLNALHSNTTGGSNTASGKDAMYSNTTGGNNTASGYEALKGNTTGADNTAVGSSSLFTNQTGSRNNAFGKNALRTMDGGIGNAGFGNETFRSTTTGSHNIGMGDYAGYYNTTGSNNIALGYRSNFVNTTGSHNVAVGYQALHNNTASDNTAIGHQALFNNTTATSNVAVGKEAGHSITTGGNNVFLGKSAGRGRTTGGTSIAIGAFSLYGSGGTSNSNIAIGYYSQFRNTTGGQNVTIGVSAMQDNTTGQDNVVLGHGAGGTGIGSHGNSNIVLGRAAKTGNFDSSVILGRDATATASNQFVVGSASYNAGAVTTETITADKTWTVKINGVDYKIPIVAA